MKRYCILLLLGAVSILAVSCGKIRSRISLVEENDIVIESQYMTVEGYEAPFNVILPAGYKTSGKRYPVLYLLHGMFNDNHSWQKDGDVVSLTQKAIWSGVIDPFIIVTPNAYLSFYVDNLEWPFERIPMPVLMFESFFVKELQPYIEKTYPVMTDREHTAIAGLSMGGYGASYYAFKYPEKYSFCDSFSGAVNGGDWTGLTDVLPSVEEIFIEKGYQKEDFDSLPQYIMDCGETDKVCGPYNTNTHNFLESVEFPHTYRRFPGGHEWSYWKDAYVRMLPELAEHFNK